MEKINVVVYRLDPEWKKPKLPANPYSGKDDLFSKLAYRMFECANWIEAEQGHQTGDEILIEIILQHEGKLSVEQRTELVRMFKEMDKWYA